MSVPVNPFTAMLQIGHHSSDEHFVQFEADETLRQIAAALVAGETVKLDRFCTFAARRKTARIGRNPKRPAVEVPITPRRVVTFRASQELRAKIDAGHKDGLNIPAVGQAWFAKAQLRMPK
jgi:nucleoid DNA-binding protein